jgi:RNA polymerase sigma-70 factor (ECF subfamily)
MTGVREHGRCRTKSEPFLRLEAILRSGEMSASRSHLRIVDAPGSDRGVTFDALFRRYARYVAAIAVRLLGRDDHEVDDVVQDVFWLASRRMHRLQDIDGARGWLVTATTRLVRRRLRRRRWRALFRAHEPLRDVPAPGATPEQRALLARLYRVLEQLPIEARLAWVLRHLEGERLEDVARACGCSLATAKRRIAAAQHVLEEVLRDE